jgi:chloride channel protein, CIC family
VIGVAAGLVARLYARTFYGAIGSFRRILLPTWLKPAVAGIVVGLLGLLVPGVLGTGYGWLQRAMTAEGLSSMAVWIVIALPIAKIAATSLTIGSGGSGGIFGPGMVIGGFVGAMIWVVAEGLSGVPTSPAPYVVVGMTACFGSIAHAPIAMILMVAEMTGTLELILPAMVAIGLATLVVGDRSIYEHQRKDRRSSPAHRFRASMPLLANVPVTTGMRPASVAVRAGDRIDDVRGRMSSAGARDAVVLDRRDRFIGVVSLGSLAERNGRIADVIDGTAPSVPQGATLEDAVESFGGSDVTIVPGLDDARRVVGVVTAAAAMQAYRLALRANLDGLAAAPPGTSLLEAVVGEHSSLVGRVPGPLLPPGSVVVAIRRGESLLIAGEHDAVRAGDDVVMLVPTGRRDEVRSLVEGA